jgi:1-acyl-sn-glycerol-3-phosphate acyltransferase
MVAVRASEKGRESPEAIKQRWSKRVLELLGVRLRVTGSPSQDRPTIFAGNHLSYLDIPLLLSQAPQANFVAKEELSRWPLFGRGMRNADTIFVQRDSTKSRGLARVELFKAVREDRKSVAIYPAGTTRLEEDMLWKPGAFRLAEETGAPLQLFRLRYKPLRRAAFIDDDAFVPHLLGLCRERVIHAEIEFAPPIRVRKWRQELEKGQVWCQEFLK